MKIKFTERTVNTELPDLIAKMRNIVHTIVANPKFHADFETNDCHVLARFEKPGIFAWYVYDSGTHLFSLNDINEVLAFQREWLDNNVETNKENSKNRLYVIDVFAGQLYRVYEYHKQKDLAAHLIQSVG
ncbi:hypothetical protein [Paenibacillus sp. MMO-58]|uniref:hypothetical protein n=1 Tax=Paenibacillus sp. MMO-58 TaxID=3081290 RepID=UPI0030197677